MTSLTRKLGLVAGLLLATLGVAPAQEMKPIRIGFQSGEINVLLSYALGSGPVQGERPRCEGLAISGRPGDAARACRRRGRSRVDG